MEAEFLKKHIARTSVNRDVIVLYMISKKYKLNLLSLITLYEIYGKDVFLFFYILSDPSKPDLVGKTTEELDLGPKMIDFPKESNLKLMFTKAKKVADALRRNSNFGLTSVTLPWYNQLHELCIRESNDVYLDFYNSECNLKDKPVKAKKKETVLA